MSEELLEEISSALNTLNITLCRIYDVQMLLLRNQNPENFDKVRAMHENGDLISGPPVVNENPFGLND